MATSAWIKVVSLSLLATAGLTGCVLPGGSGHSAVESRNGLYDTLDDTQDVLGGEWDNRDDPTARGCLVPLWVEGENFPGLRLGEAPPSPDRAATQVRESWTEWGFTVEQTLVGDVIELQGHDSVGELVIFRVSDDAMTLQGESECRPS